MAGITPPMTQPDLARLEVSARTLEEALEQNFRDGTLAGAVEIIAGTIADPIERSALEEAATRLGQVSAIIARVRELAEALEPFAKAAGELVTSDDDGERIRETLASCSITCRDLRDAALTLNKEPTDA